MCMENQSVDLPLSLQDITAACLGLWLQNLFVYECEHVICIIIHIAFSVCICIYSNTCDCALPSMTNRLCIHVCNVMLHHIVLSKETLQRLKIQVGLRARLASQHGPTEPLKVPAEPLKVQVDLRARLASQLALCMKV